MAFDSLLTAGAAALFAAAVAAWHLAAPLRPAARSYLRFAATLLAALASAAPLGLADAAALLLLPLAASCLALAALARFARPMQSVAGTFALVLALAAGLGALLSGAVMTALGPVIVAGLAVIAAALTGTSPVAALAGVALLALGPCFLAQGAGPGVMLLAAAALIGLARRRGEDAQMLLSSRDALGDAALQ
jgi:hypothetical protein